MATIGGGWPTGERQVTGVATGSGAGDGDLRGGGDERGRRGRQVRRTPPGGSGALLAPLPLGREPLTANREPLPAETGTAAPPGGVGVLPVAPRPAPAPRCHSAGIQGFLFGFGEYSHRLHAAEPICPNDAIRRQPERSYPVALEVFQQHRCLGRNARPTDVGKLDQPSPVERLSL